MKNTLTTTNKNSTCITRSTADKVVILPRYFATLPDWEVSITYSSNGLLKIYYDSLFLFFFAGDGFTGNVSESYKEKIFFSIQSFRKISYRPIHAKDYKKGFICTRETPFQCGLELDILEHAKDIGID